MARIKAVQQGTNAALIATAQALYPMNGSVFDMTPGDELGFWKEFQPESLTLLAPITEDFRNVWCADGAFDHAVFDPPYVTKGGHKTSTIDEMNKRYGMLHVEKNPMDQWNLQILPGVAEANRLLKKKGLLWFKLQDYVTSGKVWWFTKMALAELEARGFKLIDEFILDGNPGPQPLTDRCKACDGTGLFTIEQPVCPRCDGAGTIPRRQVHAARAHSVLMIAQKKRDLS